MAATYDVISTTTVGTAVASVTLSSIPQTYTDLVLIFGGSSSTLGTDSIDIQFNGDTTTNYSNTFLSSDGTSSSTGRNSNFNYGVGALITSTEIVNNIWQIFNYSNATTFKTTLVRGNIAGALLRANAILWRKTPEAITSITLKNDTAQNFIAGCTFSLYGIKAAA